MKNTVSQAFLDNRAAEFVGGGFVVDPTERDTELDTGLVEAFHDPFIHRAPQFEHFFVTRFPGLKHGMSLIFERGILVDHLGELHIVFTHEMIAFGASAFGSGAVGPLLPRQHGFADVVPAVVYEISFDDRVAGGRQNPRYRVTEKHVAEMPQMERLIGVRRQEFDHCHRPRRSCGPSLRIDRGERHIDEHCRLDLEIDVRPSSSHGENRFVRLNQSGDFLRQLCLFVFNAPPGLAFGLIGSLDVET